MPLQINRSRSKICCDASAAVAAHQRLADLERHEGVRESPGGAPYARLPARPGPGPTALACPAAPHLLPTPTPAQHSVCKPVQKDDQCVLGADSKHLASYSRRMGGARSENKGGFLAEYFIRYRIKHAQIKPDPCSDHDCAFLESSTCRYCMRA